MVEEMSDTPRTDDCTHEYDPYSERTCFWDWVDPDDMRKLERELSAAEAKITQVRQAIEHAESHLGLLNILDDK